MGIRSRTVWFVLVEILMKGFVRSECMNLLIYCSSECYLRVTMVVLWCGILMDLAQPIWELLVLSVQMVAILRNRLGIQELTITSIG
jgi:hypothetical protein